MDAQILNVLKQILGRLSHGPGNKVQQTTETKTNGIITIPENVFWYSIENTGTDAIDIVLGNGGGTFSLASGKPYSSNERIGGYFSVAVNANTSGASAAKVVWEILT